MYLFIRFSTVTHEVAGKPSEKIQKKEADCMFFDIAYTTDLDDNAIPEGKQLEDISEWLDGLDCTEKHEFTLDLRQSDTCTWLPDTDAYRTWRGGEHSFLWLHGKRTSFESHETSD